MTGARSPERKSSGRGFSHTLLYSNYLNNFTFMSLSALSSLDGRYKKGTEKLSLLFSEYALMRARLGVEIRYFIALGEEKSFKELQRLTKTQKTKLLAIEKRLNQKEAQKVKSIEARTKHDIKAIEYYLKEKIKKIKGLEDKVEFVHFGLTSEDVSNLAYGQLIHKALETVVIPKILHVRDELAKRAKQWREIVLLGMTHGQPATPTTLGKEMQVFVGRLDRQIELLEDFRMQGKFGGAVGNFSAHKIAVPKVNWGVFGKKFVQSLGLEHLPHTTQINPHDDIAELSHVLSRINTICIDFARDMWLYISREVFSQKLRKSEVGSSTMPHKINPINFENAEGNLGLSNALLHHFAEKLPISRLQRDLSDSTVQRNIGVALGYQHIALDGLESGLGRVSVDRKKVSVELREHPEVLAEAIQTLLRLKSVDGAYERLKEVTRGNHVEINDLISFMEKNKFSKKEIKRITSLLAK